MSWAGSIPVSLGPSLEGRLTRHHCLAILMAILYSVKNRADHDAQKKMDLQKSPKDVRMPLWKAGQLDVDGTTGSVGILAERL